MCMHGMHADLTRLLRGIAQRGTVWALVAVGHGPACCVPLHCMLCRIVCKRVAVGVAGGRHANARQGGGRFSLGGVAQTEHVFAI